MVVGARGSWVLNAQLNSLIEDYLAKVQKIRGNEIPTYEQTEVDAHTPNGGIEQFAHEVSLFHTSSTRDSCIRRLYAIRSGERRITGLNFADAAILATGETLHTAGVHVFPNSVRGAREMIEAWYEAREIDVAGDSEELAVEMFGAAKTLSLGTEWVAVSPNALSVIGGEYSHWLRATS